MSISVTTGHGTLQLSNTSLFEGSFLQLGDRIFAEITKDMSLDVPEGSYTLAVANNGWGDSTDIEIKRGEITKVNLNDLKGEGPKKSRILFEVDVQSAKIYVDDSEIDYTSPVEITYGKHRLKVTADGYDTWTRTLYVNSKEATIQITINDNMDSSGSDSSGTGTSSIGSSQATAQTPSETAAERADEKDNQSTSQSTTGSSQSTNSSQKTDNKSSDSSGNSLTNKEISDYLSTLTSLLSSK